ncbi:toprim domain-containing protein [Patescibacteria group bacterium]|nr:toprim domain-containing protein [Patescibacteria group bacterium]MBU2220105.1 toprim domain-containing protein [Patescibacteria group bacterium]MBU2264804.1 toprim domain-containing protein [Patescibacteria group bacterium]
MPDGVIDQIKQKLDVLEVLGDYIKLAKAGRSYKARCPFHAEKSASFMVSPERQIWHCFGCGLGGDIFGFVMKIEGVEFGDALRLLARRAGVVLKKQDPQIQSQKKRLYEICELAAKFFETQLHKTAAGQKAYHYLTERGLKAGIIKEWRLGWAHDNWRALYEFLKSRGYKDEENEQAGLIIKRETDYNSPKTPKAELSSGLKLRGGERSEGALSHYYDRFRSRIIFPIFDSQGQIIAFGGRIFGEAAKKDEMAKYLNSPQTPLYDKSSVLYGLHKAKNEIRIKNQCVIVEGYMDLIMSHQAGVFNVVASSGTALTAGHLNIIGRYTKNLFMAFDSDEAGNIATRRSIDLALRRDFDVKVIIMEEKDPADIIKKDSAEWRKVIDQAQGIMDFYFVYAFAKHDVKSAEGKREIRKILLTAIKSLASQTEQGEWLGELARRLRVNEKDLTADMKKIKLEEAPERNDEPGGALPETMTAKSRLEWLEERFLGLCLSHPHYFSKEIASEVNFCDKELAQIFQELKKMIGKKKDEKALNKLRQSLKPELKTRIDYISFQLEQHERDEKDIIKEIKTCVPELKILRFKKDLLSLNFDIKDAQEVKDKNKLNKLLKKFNQLSAELTKINI